jgi:hypothetical protein
MARYSEDNCFWCSKKLPYNPKTREYTAVYSLGTDTVFTRRNFCDEECINAFKDFFGFRGGLSGFSKTVTPYKGKRKK